MMQIPYFGGPLLAGLGAFYMTIPLDDEGKRLIAALDRQEEMEEDEEGE